MLTLLHFVPDEPPEGTFSEVAGNFESQQDLDNLVAAFSEHFDQVQVVNTAHSGWQDRLKGAGTVFNYTHGFELMAKGVQPTFFLEGSGFDYRGADPIGMMLSANKPHTAELMASLGFLCPAAVVVPAMRALNDPDLLAPLVGCDQVVLKPAYEEASVGLRLLPNDQSEVAAALHELRPHIPGPFLVMQYIHGIDVTVPIIGHPGPHCLPAVALHRLEGDLDSPWVFDAIQKRSKRGLEYRDTLDWDQSVTSEIYRMAEAGFRVTSQRDWARVDCRVDSAGHCWFLEVTPNPEVSPGKGSFTVSGGAAGMTFADVLAHIVDRRAPGWRPTPSD